MTPLFSSPQRPTYRVVLQVGGDDVVAVLDQPLEAQVQPIGAVVSEDPPLGCSASEELIEPMSRVIEHFFGRQSHSMPRTPRIGKARARIDPLPDKPVLVWESWWRRCRDKS